MSANRSAPLALQHGVRTPTAHNARATPPARLRAIPHKTDRAQRGNRRRRDRGTKPDRQASQILDDGRSVTGNDEQSYDVRLNAETTTPVTDVRFGSKADIAECETDVRFTSKSGHWNLVAKCLVCARKRHWPKSAQIGEYYVLAPGM